MFFDMSLERNEGSIDKVCGFLIRVRLSFQLSTGASGGRGREIDQERLVFRFGLRQGGIDIA